MLPDKELYLGYESLRDLSGSFKDELVCGLQTLIRKDDHRTPKALWELGVIYLTHFANPRHTINEGLRYIRESAQAGDVRAKALCYRLHDAFGSSALDKTATSQKLKWLREAAECGHQSAIEELRELDYSAAVNAQAEFAASFYQSPDESSALDSSMRTETFEASVNGYLPVHRAAATGHLEELMILLVASDENLNLTNDEGDTPLMAACRFGQLATALALLESGCDPTLRNSFGENALHFVWCFNSEDGGRLAREMLAKGAQVDDVSKRTVWASELDLRPIVRGTPLDRAAARGRDDLILIFLESGEV